MRNDGISCEALERALHEGQKLTKEELAHVEDCDECMDVWLTLALEAKPEVAIPDGFATRIAAMAPARPEKRQALRTTRHWGMISAITVVTVMMMICFAGPRPVNSGVGLVFMLVVATEIAGLALWLAPRWSGR